MSSFISGGGRTYGFDIELVKSPSNSSRTSSPSSALSESINSPHALSTRKPRTPRKRPNQIYNEAAALLSTVYPKIFSSKNLTNPGKHAKVFTSLPDEFSDFLPPSPAFRNVEFLLHQPISHKPTLSIELKPAPSSTETPCQSSPMSPAFDNYFQVNSEEDFDAESILDEEIEEGIDSIMGNLSVDNNSGTSHSNPPCWNPVVGLGKFDFRIGINGGVSALRHTDDVDWWRFPTVDILAISPKLNKVPCERKKKKKKKKKKIARIEELKIHQSSLENPNPNPNPDSGIGLKLSYEKVLDAWSDRGSPFSEDILGTESSESDAIARLAQIDLFSENGGLREASVLRYREKRRSRLFSKKIRYQVRKVNADRRPRMKGRFVRRPVSALRDEKN